MWEQGRSLDEASSRTLAPGSILWFPRTADGFPSLWRNNRQKELKLGGEVCFDSVSNHDGQEGRVESSVMGGVARPPLVLVNKEAESQAETLLIRTSKGWPQHNLRPHPTASYNNTGLVQGHQNRHV